MRELAAALRVGEVGDKRTGVFVAQPERAQAHRSLLRIHTAEFTVSPNAYRQHRPAKHPLHRLARSDCGYLMGTTALLLCNALSQTCDARLWGCSQNRIMRAVE